MKKHRSFAAWLRDQRMRDDPVGDLARDAADDPQWPKAPRSLQRLLAYIEASPGGDCTGALESCRRAWAEFRTR